MASRRSREGAEGPRRPRLKKALGQHHLTSSELCRPAIEFLGSPMPGPVLEIGPGGGVLTRALLEARWRVLAVELDREWAFELRRRFPPSVSRRLRVAVDDALDLAFAGLATAGWGNLETSAPESCDTSDAPSGSQEETRRWAIAGNLPYSVSTAIVERVLDEAPVGTRCAFLVQKEVADRLLAEPGGRTYGSLSVLVSLRSRAVRLARVRPGSFHPPPKVESAFVGLEIRSSEHRGGEWHALKRTVRAAFERRRKTLSNVLAAGFGGDRSRAALAACEIDGRLRAETLAPERFLALHEALRVTSS